MNEVIETYLNLHWQVTKSRGSFDNQSDKLTYTTTFTASVTPKIVLNPGGLNNLKLSQADLNPKADRVDVHEVLFTITPVTEPPPTNPYVKAVKLDDGVVLHLTPVSSNVQRENCRNKLQVTNNSLSTHPFALLRCINQTRHVARGVFVVVHHLVGVTDFIERVSA